MDKKLTTSLGIALGASLLAGAGYGIYKFFSTKRAKATGNDLSGLGRLVSTGFPSGYIGDSLVKSHTLYGPGTIENGLVGGGLYKTQSGLVANA